MVSPAGRICRPPMSPPPKTSTPGFSAGRYQDLPTPDGRSYAQAFMNGRLVATIAPQSPLQPSGTPAQWNVYFAAANAAALLDDATHAGGNVQFGPEQVGGHRRLGVPGPARRRDHRDVAGRNASRAATFSTNRVPWPGRNCPRLSRRPPSASSSSCSGTRSPNTRRRTAAPTARCWSTAARWPGSFLPKKARKRAWQIYFGVADVRGAVEAVGPGRGRGPGGAG